jgi:hypothetical protein
MIGKKNSDVVLSHPQAATSLTDSSLIRDPEGGNDLPLLRLGILLFVGRIFRKNGYRAPKFAC